MKVKKNAQREAIAVNLAHRMVHPYMFGTETINPGCFALSPHRQQYGSFGSVPVNNDYSAHAHYNQSVFVPALAFNPMSFSISESGPR